MKQKTRAGVWCSLVQHLPSMHRALDSIPSTKRRKEKTRGREKVTAANLVCVHMYLLSVHEQKLIAMAQIHLAAKQRERNNASSIEAKGWCLGIGESPDSTLAGETLLGNL